MPKEQKVSKAAVAKELELPKKDPKPTQPPRSAGSRRPRRRPPQGRRRQGRRRTARRPSPPPGSHGRARASRKERALRQPVAPARPTSTAARSSSSTREFQAGGTTLQGAVHQGPGPGQQGRHDQEAQGRLEGRRRHDPRPHRQDADSTAPHLLFEIRPAGKGAPRIDPKPILDGWKLLESTAIYRAAGKNPFFGPDAKNPSIGQILLMSKEALQHRVLDDSRIEIYDCGRTRHPGGHIDRRVLATLEFLAASRPEADRVRAEVRPLAA